MNHLLAALTLTMGALVATIVSATVLRKLWSDRREAAFEDAKMAMRPAVFALISSDGEDTETLQITMGMSSGRRHLELRRRAVNHLLVNFTQRLRGEIVDEIRAFLIEQGFAEGARRNLRRRSTWERATAAQELGYLADRQSVPSLVALLDDRDQSVRIAATRALGLIGDASAARALLSTRDRRRQVPYGPASDALLHIGTDAVPALMQALSHRNFRVRRLAVDVLGELGISAAVDRLIHLLRHDGDTLVRIRAANALGRLATGDVLSELYDSLRLENADIRQSIVRAVAGIGARGSVAVLRRAVADPDHRTAQVAAGALAELGSSGVAILTAIAAGEDRASLYAIEALDAIKPVAEHQRLRVLAGAVDAAEAAFPTTGITAR